ncbi:DUF5677 domain-containing protein [Lentzea aerocolonigenes]|uniref:DUF5677 domain-containing protein n=1 Tax=Lentzea aerocolonigenes TaxID=68170 RepID=UPI0004C3DFD6|nr:DUF5677 domain-containing protein [Lentzea aerocolonigenes]
MRLLRRGGRDDFDHDTFTMLVEGTRRFTDAGLAEDEATEASAKAWIQAMDLTAPVVAADIRRTAPRMLRRRRRGHKLFQRALQAYWGRPLDLYLAVCVAVHEAGERFDKRLAREAEERQDFHFEVLTGLHARACRTAFEVHHALAGGFPMAALARCRTLHEIAVIMRVLSEFGETDDHADLAERFYLHEAVLTAKDARTYQLHCAELGTDPLPAEEIAQLDQSRQELLDRFGTEYKESYGWATGLNGLRRPNFAELEKLVNVAHLRGHYSWASHEIHADARGSLLNVFEQGQTLYKQTGPMLFGFAEPAVWALASLELCVRTLLHSTDEVSPIELLGCKALEHLIADGSQLFEDAETFVEKMEQQVHRWTPWRRHLWVEWRLIFSK